jgi:hypothetical protein
MNVHCHNSLLMRVVHSPWAFSVFWGVFPVLKWSFCQVLRSHSHLWVWFMLFLTLHWINDSVAYPKLTCELFSFRSTRNKVSSSEVSRSATMLSRVGVTYKTGFGLDYWIYCTLYIHNSGRQAIQRYRYSTHFPLHHYAYTRVLNLH